MSDGARGAVASPHAAASEAGERVLRRGGSAADAAIAMNAVLCVAYPHMAGLGGDGFWLVWDPGDREAHGINASGPAAALATRAAYGDVVGGGIPERGARAALTVPGAVDGWRLAHERWGRLPWAELFAEAIGLARDGVLPAPSLRRYHARDLVELRAHPEAAALFAAAGAGAGRALLQPGLAGALEIIARDGARAFYEGALGEEIGGAAQERGSPLRAADLAQYRAEWVRPLRGGYRGYELLELPPNTQGIAAIELLRLLDGYDVAAWGDLSADYVHMAVEATKLAFADRDAWVGDPRFVEAPLERLASAEYAGERRALIERERALPAESLSAGISPSSPDSGPGALPGPTKDGDTVYFCAVDAAGLAVSCIQSIYHAFGSMVVAGDTGILLHNRGIAFSLDPASANALAPGKRPFHTLIPAMLLKNGEPWLVFGTMGGEGQPQTQAALVTRIVDFGRDPVEAVAAARWLWGRTWGEPSRVLTLEAGFPAATVEELVRRGHDVHVLPGRDELMGHAQLLLRRGERWSGAADPRGDGSALLLS